MNQSDRTDSVLETVLSNINTDFYNSIIPLKKKKH